VRAGGEADARVEIEGSIRVLIVDAHAQVRDRIAGVLAAAEGIEPVGTAEDGRMACGAVLALNPDVVLLAAGLPGAAGPETTAWLRQQRPGVRVVALADPHDHTGRAAMRRAGAVTAVSPGAPPAEISAAVLTAVAAP
jgi:DNA-binding NarL/FixJ family response regulator